MSVTKPIYFNDWYIKIPASKAAGKIDTKARYQVVHLETVTNLCASSRQENVIFCIIAANCFQTKSEEKRRFLEDKSLKST